MLKSKKIAIFISLTLFTFIGLMFIVIQGNISVYSEKSHLIPKSSGYWVETGIYIDSNAEWLNVNSTEPWCTGAGTIDDPYIIQDVVINGLGSLNPLNRIFIVSTTVYFRIENCTVYNTRGFGGIILSNVRNGNLTENNLNNNSIGIFLVGSDNNTIMNNEASNNIEFGIVLGYSQYNIVDNNTANYNSEQGITMSHSDYNNITGNTANYNGHFGIGFEYSSYNLISGNTLLNNLIGCIGKGATSYNNIEIDNICTYDYSSFFNTPLGILTLIGLISLPFVGSGFYVLMKKFSITPEVR